jgi:hypothetical protein
MLACQTKKNVTFHFILFSIIVLIFFINL